MSSKEKVFRWDIQGLRAIAVLSVVIFHISPRHLPGGFLGVDIFFVISGFLIIGFIHRDLQRGDFSLSDFYFKRVKRLLPALILVVLCSSIFASLLLTPQEFSGYVKSLWSTVFYVSNLYFYSESGYFDSSLALSPLLHTWSLSVEEQFYIVAPIALLIIYKVNSKAVVFYLLLFSFFSLVFSEVFVYFDRDLSFYASPSRFWQFTLGGILAIRFSTLKVRALYYDLIGFFGLLSIIYSLFFYTESTVFPGVNAILPTLATAMVIFSGFNRGYIYRVLSNKIGVFFGNISYSLYLWHWPVIVFYKLSIGSTIKGEAGKVVILILSILLGYLSWLYIERNGRLLFHKPKNYSVVILSVLSVCLVSSILQTINARGFTEAQLGYASYLNYKSTEFRAGSCFLTSKYNDFKLYDKNNCITHKVGSKNYVLFGDSHAAHWFDAMNKTKSSDVTITQVTSSGCKPTVSYKGEKRCTELLQWGFEELLSSKKFDKVILSARWGYDDVLSLKATIDKLKLYTDDIVILGPTVEYDMPLPRVLAFNRGEIKINSHRFYEKSKGIDAAIDSAVSDIENVEYISILKILCPSPVSCITRTSKGVPIAFDYGHFTASGALHVLSNIEL